MNTPPEIKGGTAAANLVILVLLAGVVSLGVWTFRLRGQLESSQNELAEVRSKTAPASTDTAAIRALRTRVTELESQLQAATQAVPAPAEAPPQRGSAVGTIASQMMNNPAMRNMANAAQRRALESQFATIFAQLGFSEEQKARFLDLQMEQMSQATDLGLRLLAGDLSQAERADIQRQIQQREADSNAAMAAFFAAEFPGQPGPYAEFQRLMDQRPDQTQVDALQASLAGSGNPLTAQQSTALVQILNEERKTFTFSQNADAAADPTAAFDPEVVQTRIREQGELDQRIIRRASLVLAPAQVEALRESQASRLQLIQSSADMARAMFGSGN